MVAIKTNILFLCAMVKETAFVSESCVPFCLRFSLRFFTLKRFLFLCRFFCDVRDQEIRTMQGFIFARYRGFAKRDAVKLLWKQKWKPIFPYNRCYGSVVNERPSDLINITDLTNNGVKTFRYQSYPQYIYLSEVTAKVQSSMLRMVWHKCCFLSGGF